MNGLQIGIALGADEITAVLPTRDLVLPLEPSLHDGPNDPGPALRAGFERLEAGLRSEFGDDRLEGGVRLQVALLPPLSEARLVDLPPLRTREIDAVLHRVAPRHFLGGAQVLVVGGERFGKEGSTGSVPVFAAAANRGLVEAVYQAAASRGWQLERIVSASAAWVHALRQAVPLSTKGRSGLDQGTRRLVVAVEGEVAHLVRMTGEQPDRLRRVAARDPSEVLAGTGPETGWALLLAEPEMHARLARALMEAGWEIAPSEEPRGARSVAARHAAEASPELVPPSLSRVRRQRDRRITVRMLVAAVLMLAAAAAVHLWGVGRALRTVQGERAALRETFAPALALRDSLDRMNERIDSLRDLEKKSTRWTAFLVELSMLLPRDTHLVSLRGEGNRVVVEAVGGPAGEALSALRKASTFRDVRIEGLIQRDLEEGTTSREHFTLSLVLAPDEGEPGEGQGGNAGPHPDGGGR
jgi:hypothetical protein